MYPEIKKYRFKIIALGFILIVFVGLIINPVQIVIDDFWYHLSVIKQIIDQGQFVFWDQVGFQPIGRPNIYPPLLHVVGAIFLAWFDQLIPAAFYLGNFCYVGFLSVFWFFVNRFWGEKVALVALLTVTVSSTLSLAFFSLMPASLALLFLFPLLMAFHDRKLKPTIIFLVLLFYLYTPFYFLIIISLGLFVYRFRDYKLLYQKALLLSLAAGLPWLVYYFLMRPELNAERWVESGTLETVGLFSHYSINPVFYCLASIGLIRLSKTNDKSVQLLYYVLVGFLPYLVLYGGRYFWHLFPFFVIFAILQFKPNIEKFLGKFNLEKAFLSLVLAIFLIVPLPSIEYNSFADQRRVSPDYTILDLILMDLRGFDQEENFRALVSYIQTQTAPDTILKVDDPILAQSLYIYTGRASDNGLFWESVSAETIDQLAKMRESDETTVFVYHFSDLPDKVMIEKEFGTYRVGFLKTD